jgi:TolB-like protein
MDRISGLIVCVTAFVMFAGCAHAPVQSKEVYKQDAFVDGKIISSTQADDKASQHEVVFAVLEFENNSGQPDWNYMQAGIPDIISADLSTNSDYKVVERKKMQEIISEMKLGMQGYTDAATAQQIGKLTGANVLVFGSVTKFDTKIIITTRMVKVETGDIIGSIIEKGNKVSQLPDMCSSIANKVCGKLVER